MPLIVDDTLSTAVNVDLIGGNSGDGGVQVDVIWTSLSKSFSGVGNVMGGRFVSFLPYLSVI